MSLGTSTPEIRAMLCVPLALALLVPGVAADDVNAAVAPDDPALLTHSLHACSDFHMFLVRYLDRYVGIRLPGYL